ncbi:MAG TPA: hypothetical protein DEB25_01475 [Desulfobulbaceae bacterium]|nr:hypothetical protein [Desulfobulbaceae bacterium]
MDKNEKTSAEVASLASETFRDSNASKIAKRLAGSALSQTGSSKTTSPAIAEAAGKALGNPRSSETTARLAGSVLTQKPKKRR